MHARRAIVELPTWVQLQIVLYRREIEIFTHQLLDEAQPFDIYLGIETPAAPSCWLDYSTSLPYAESLRMDIQQLRDDAYWKNWGLHRMSYAPFFHSSSDYIQVSITRE